MNQKVVTTTTGSRKRAVHFDDETTQYHEAPAPLEPEEIQAMWYTAMEMKESFENDVRVTLKTYMKLVKEHKRTGNSQVMDIGCMKGDDCYSRGLELLSPAHRARTTRSDLYRSLVIKQYKTLKTSMCGGHACEMLGSFASKHSQWAVDRAKALAAEDAAEARQVYRDAFLSKGGVGEGCGILAVSGRRSLKRPARRQLNSAPSA